MQTFARRLELDVPADQVFAWHARPGAFERLMPPWESARLIGPAAPLEAGARQVTGVSLGPIPLRWHSEITEVVEGQSFTDVQLSGPFARWEHTHRMIPNGTGSVLEDDIRYRLPLGPLGAIGGGALVRSKLERMFGYRHRITAWDLARHAGGGPPMDVVVSGASGFVGRALVAFLTTGGHRVRRLVRREPTSPDEIRWEPELDPAALAGADAVVHLAGEGIADRRWSASQKARIRDSRVDGTRRIVEAMAARDDGPRTLVCASAVGFYGDRGDELLTENSAPGDDFLAEVCRAWEGEAERLDGRVVQLRFGVVLGAGGGALARMLTPFGLGFGGPMGHGRQWMSWVALDDVVGAIHHALRTRSLSGAVNVVAPEPVTNAAFARTLGRVLRRPALAWMPATVARLAFGEVADALLLASQRVSAGRLIASGYSPVCPDLESALRHQLGRVVASSG